MKRLEAALKSFGPGFRVYQYLFKSNRPEIPFASYDDPVVQTEVNHRREFFCRKARSTSIRSRSSIAFSSRLPVKDRHRSGTFAGWSSDPARRVRRTEGSVRKRRHEDPAASADRNATCAASRTASARRSSVSSATSCRLKSSNQQGQFRFFRRLLNYDDWRIAGSTEEHAISRLPGRSIPISRPSATICAWAITSSAC